MSIYSPRSCFIDLLYEFFKKRNITKVILFKKKFIFIFILILKSYFIGYYVTVTLIDHWFWKKSLNWIKKKNKDSTGKSIYHLWTTWTFFFTCSIKYSTVNWNNFYSTSQEWFKWNASLDCSWNQSIWHFTLPLSPKELSTLEPVQMSLGKQSKRIRFSFSFLDTSDSASHKSSVKTRRIDMNNQHTKRRRRSYLQFNEPVKRQIHQQIILVTINLYPSTILTLQ